jgi:polyribonucleotide nucleotidyltransferase
MHAEKTVTKVSRDYERYARKIKAMGDSVEKIQTITGLTEDAIKSL